ncbi:DeoR/GlpR family DNA-binding transcription regulator [uncultured Paraglaciecola sp.]|uniref:DeoR/GlpR family DNA-binding transcription regulator n=1 Tax=uncultured Paraglaciecola sp. TaxID=1765024 RepID=UPI0030DC456B|tara:strand:+ start:362129 stop:362920 length:792 start_codon:yes stop_codon:yes gene_type:complete
MHKSQRHHLILDLLDERHLITVQELTDELSASEATIRRDLVELAEEHKLKKIHGGAERLDPHKKRKLMHLEGSAFLVDKERMTREKQLIARKAVELCEDGESIIINGGSSTYMMAEYLAKRELNILTNSFPLALELLETSDNRITLPGGELYRKQKLILSAFEHDTIKHYHGTKMFMGTPGIGDYGVMESDPLLISAEQKLMRQVDQLIVLADSSKLGKRSNFILCPLEEVDVLITDSGVDEKYLRLFAEHGVQTIIVDANKN